MKTRPAQIAALAAALDSVKATANHPDPEHLQFAMECYYSALADCTYPDVKARARAAFARI